MNKNISRLILSLISATSLLLNTFAPIAYAQETTPSPTPTPTQSESPSPTPTPTVSASPSSSPEPETGTLNVSTDQNTNGGQDNSNLPDNDLTTNEPGSAQLVPSVTTDKADYSPTEKVTLTGNDFSKNSDLTIKVTWPDGVVRSSAGNTDQTDQVTTDGGGSFVFFYDLRGQGQGGEYQVAILMGTSVLANTTFTDSNVVLGSITVCKLIENPQGAIVNGSDVPGAEFSITGFIPDPPTSAQAPVGEIGKTTFTTPIDLNSNILGNDNENDANCVTYGNLEMGSYYYSQEALPATGWETPKYNDQYTVNVASLNDFFPYSGELFDNNSGNDDLRNQNSDGNIVLNNNKPNRTLVILNQYKEPQVPKYQCSQTVYAANNNSNLYWVDKSNGDVHNLSTLDFGSSASADDPFSHRTYYAERNGSNDRLAYYDHDTSSSSIVGVGDLNVPSFFTKLAFNVYGELYGLTDDHHLYKIDTSTPVANDLGVVGGVATGGDIVFDENNTLYLIGTDGRFYIVDTSTRDASLVKSTGLSPVTGLAYDGTDFFVSVATNGSSQSSIYRMDKDGNATLLSIEQSAINDLSSCLPGQEKPPEIPRYEGSNQCSEGLVPEKIGSYTVSSTDADGETLNLTPNQEYLFKASGTFNPNTSGYVSDAGYTWVNEILSTLYGINGTPPNLGAHALLANLGLGVGIVNWGADNPSHEYSFAYTPTNSFQQFVIGDRYDHWFNTSWDDQTGMSDNEGSLNLDVYKCVSPAQITGYKWNDENGNQQRDNNEPGLEGWTIKAVEPEPVATVNVDSREVNGNSSSVLPAGDYLFVANGDWLPKSDPNYKIDSEYLSHDNWATYSDGPDVGKEDRGDFQLNNQFVEWGPYNPNHTYYLNWNLGKDAAVNFSVFDGNTAKVPGWYGDNSGTITVTIYKVVDEQVTASDGSYTLNIPGNVNHVLVFEIPQRGWVQDYPNNPNHYDLEVVPGTTADNINFGNRSDAPFKILASKVVCDNEADLPNWGNHGAVIGANAAQNYVEEHKGCHLQEGWQFQWAKAGSGSFGAFQTNTNELGDPWHTFSSEATFNDLSVLGGRIEVREVFPNNNYVPFSNAGNVSSEFYCTGDVSNYDNWEWVNNPQYGQTSYCVGFNALNTGSISGMKYEDLNGDGQNDEDPGIQGWTIKLLQGENLINTAETDNNGNYAFDNVVVGDYTVCEVGKNGYQNTDPGNNCQDVTVNPNENTGGVDFGNFHLGKIAGYKYNDENGNGVWDDGEPALDDWEICLDTENCVTTGSNDWPTGYYEFTGVTAGDHTITETLQDNWLQKEPGDPNSHTVNVQSGTGLGDEASQYNFGNQEILLGLSLTKTNDVTGTLSPGDTVNYTLEVTNTGNQDLTSVEIKDSLPGGFDYVSGSSTFDGSSTADPTAVSGTLVWQVGGDGKLAVGETKTLQYQATINSGVVDGDYTNIAVATGIFTYTPPEKQIEGFLLSLVLADESTISKSVDSGDPLATSTVAVASSINPSRSVNGQVLGASTELLPASGSPTELMLSIIALMALGGVLKISALTLEKRNKKHV